MDIHFNGYPFFIKLRERETGENFSPEYFKQNFIINFYGYKILFKL